MTENRIDTSPIRSPREWVLTACALASKLPRKIEIQSLFRLSHQNRSPIMHSNPSRYLHLLTAFALLAGLNACTESEDPDDDGIPDYTVPESYSAFEGVDFAGQTARLDMLGKLGAYVKTGNTP